MPTTRPNLAQTPVNSDTLNWTGDLATLADSLEVIIPVSSDSVGDTIATQRAAAGFPVTDARPLFTYDTTTKTARVKDSTGWRNLADTLKATFAHVGKTAGFQTITGITTVTFPNPQIICGGIIWDAGTNSLVVPRAGYYRVRGHYYATGGSGGIGLCQGWLVKNGVTGTILAGRAAFWKGDTSDFTGYSEGTVLLAANDKISMVMNFAASTWGTTGYDGAYMEVEQVAAAGQF